jgi:hypothetical protein
LAAQAACRLLVKIHKSVGLQFLVVELEIQHRRGLALLVDPTAAVVVAAKMPHRAARALLALFFLNIKKVVSDHAKLFDD